MGSQGFGLGYAQAVLAGLERPLLSTSVHVESEQEGALEVPEAAVMMDQFAGRGLDFVIDCGTRVSAGTCHISPTTLGAPTFRCFV